MTSATPLLTKVDSADLAAQAGVPFLPHHCLRIPPEAARLVDEQGGPRPTGYMRRRAPLLAPPNKLSRSLKKQTNKNSILADGTPGWIASFL